MSAVSVAGVRVGFDGVPVLRDVDFAVHAGGIVALLGPSGCGKTTLLRTIAGLERPDGGRIVIGDRVLEAPGVSVPPEHRRVGMVFQDWALFPHMSVARNVGYGLPRHERRDDDRVEAVLAMVGLDGLGDRIPSTLSGGQQQRVALARAIAPQPSVLLLDEPFSNLDSTLRVQVRGELHRLLVELGITTVFVTHDQDEAFILGDEVAVMHNGGIVQQDAPAVLYDDPVDEWVATFVGDANLLAGDATGSLVETAIGPVPLRHEAAGPVSVLVRPEAVTVAPGDDAEVELVEYYGHDTVYLVRLDDGETLRTRATAAPRLGRGDRVAVTFGGPPTRAYPRNGTAPRPAAG